MARLIVDTGVLVGTVRGRIGVDVLTDADDVALPAVVVAEYLAGVHPDPDRGRSAAHRAFLEEVLDIVPVIDYDTDIAEHHAFLLAHTTRAGRRRGPHDLLIAATAVASGRTLLTTDERAGFAELPGVEVRLVS